MPKTSILNEVLTVHNTGCLITDVWCMCVCVVCNVCESVCVCVWCVMWVSVCVCGGGGACTHARLCVCVSGCVSAKAWNSVISLMIKVFWLVCMTNLCGHTLKHRTHRHFHTHWHTGTHYAHTNTRHIPTRADTHWPTAHTHLHTHILSLSLIPS